MLIDSRVQVSSISSGFCEQMALEIHPLVRLLELKGMGRVAIPYLGYTEVHLKISGIRWYNKDILLLVIPTMTSAKKVLVMVSSKLSIGP